MTKYRARIMGSEVPLSTGLSFDGTTPTRRTGLHLSPEARFIAEVMALPRLPPTAPATGADLAAAVAWLARTSPDEVRRLLSSYPTAGSESAAPAAVTPRVLETLYEAVAWADNGSPFDTRKAQGSFHTPVDLVDAMVADALDAFLETQPDRRAALQNIRIVDPSVGPGAFLEGALRALRGRGLRDVPPGALCGIDISPLAVEVCRHRLTLAGYPDADLRVGNSLVDDASFSWRESWPSGFDLVVGNPPYLRDSQKKTLDAEALRGAYRAATSHYDLYVLFMERALQIARPGGVVCLLTSNRWLAQKYGRGIRGMLVEQRLRGILDLRFRGFDGAAVHTSITLVEKAPPRPEDRTLLDVVDGLENLGSLLDLRRPSVPQASLGEGPFRFHVNPAEHALGERLRAVGRPLSDYAFVSLGMVFHDPRAGGKRKADYLRTEPAPGFTTPLLDGEHVCRWTSNGNLWLDYRPDEHREPRFPELFTADKVLCRRIIGRGRVIAMVDARGRWFSDNVVGVVPTHAIVTAASRTARLHCTAERIERSREVDVHFLAALLNSRLIDWYYQKLLGFGMHLYPAHLKNMPVIIPTRLEQAPLAALARRAADRDGDPAAVEAEIDTRVYDLYGLSEAERARIGNYYDEHQERETADLDG